jgi:uncharacterized protein with NAD-binding domain and iron-sulfur cluster
LGSTPVTGGRRIAILGGGAGALSAAYWLTRGDWDPKVDSVTVYQRGWRLGGKGASGRGVHDRIEEHGLHIWFGFYENAFRTLRGCYDDLERLDSVPIRSIEDAFEPASSFVLTERRREGWLPWTVEFPRKDGVPGDLSEGAREALSPSELLEQCLRLLLAQLRAARSGRPSPGAAQPASQPPPVRLEPVMKENPFVRLDPVPPVTKRPKRPVRSVAGWMFSRLQTLPVQLAEEVLELAIGIAESLHRDDLETPDNPHERMSGHIDRVASLINRYLRPLLEDSDELRRQWYLIDLLLAIARGSLTDRLLTAGLDAVDDVDFVQWLTKHGAQEESAGSVLVTAVVYDMAFAYRYGDPAHPACSAATALRGLARVFFEYKGAVAYKMRAGMGDVVFAPLYELLRERGVKFEFFCDVRELRPSPDGRSISEISINRQLRLRDPKSEYDPLVDVQGLPCWPAEPRWEQLKRPTKLNAPDLERQWAPSKVETLVLRAGKDFDAVVLGIGVGALGTICRPLIEQDPSWRRMVQGLGTVWTQSLQLWLSRSPAELGDVLPGATIGGFREPFDTFADMQQLIERESWNGQVRGIAYFCNALATPSEDPSLTDADSAIQAHEDVRRNALRFLQLDLADLLPGAARRYPADFRWELLVGDDKPGDVRADRLNTQYWRANIDPSDRYVQSLPGTSRLRKRPGDSGFSNLVLAGDWTDCGLNAGCVEAAVSSGMLAAHALCGRPVRDEMFDIAHLIGGGS